MIENALICRVAPPQNKFNAQILKLKQEDSFMIFNIHTEKGEQYK